MIQKEIKNKGFTLVETLVAIFVLTISITSFMSVVTSGLFAARYARDEITSNYLLQEAVDYIRNDRDSSVIIQTAVPTDQAWDNFLAKYADCFNQNEGCYIDTFKEGSTPKLCAEQLSDGTKCPPLYYDPIARDGDFYNYSDDNVGDSVNPVVKTSIKRQIVVELNPNNSDEIYVKVTVSWKNAGVLKKRILKTSLTKWQ